MAEGISRRVPVNIEAEITAYNVSYPAFIGNISIYGMHAKVPNMEREEFTGPETDIDLKFRLPSGETVNLYCRKKWACKNTSNSYIENIGVEIIDPPDEFKDFYRAVSHI